MVVLICFSSTVFTAALYKVMPETNTLAVSIFCFLLGSVMFSSLVVAFDFGVELTYPIAESMSTGIIMSSGQIFGIVFTLICSFLITKDD